MRSLGERANRCAGGQRACGGLLCGGVRDRMHHVPTRRRPGRAMRRSRLLPGCCTSTVRKAPCWRRNDMLRIALRLANTARGREILPEDYCIRALRQSASRVAKDRSEVQRARAKVESTSLDSQRRSLVVGVGWFKEGRCHTVRQYISNSSRDPWCGCCSNPRSDILNFVNLKLHCSRTGPGLSHPS